MKDWTDPKVQHWAFITIALVFAVIIGYSASQYNPYNLPEDDFYDEPIERAPYS